MAKVISRNREKLPTESAYLHKAFLFDPKVLFFLHIQRTILVTLILQIPPLISCSTYRSYCYTLLYNVNDGNVLSHYWNVSVSCQTCYGLDILYYHQPIQQAWWCSFHDFIEFLRHWHVMGGYGLVTQRPNSQLKYMWLPNLQLSKFYCVYITRQSRVRIVATILLLSKYGHCRQGLRQLQEWSDDNPNHRVQWIWNSHLFKQSSRWGCHRYCAFNIVLCCCSK